MDRNLKLMIILSKHALNSDFNFFVSIRNRTGKTTRKTIDQDERTTRCRIVLGDWMIEIGHTSMINMKSMNRDIVVTTKIRTIIPADQDTAVEVDRVQGATQDIIEAVVDRLVIVIPGIITMIITVDLIDPKTIENHNRNMVLPPTSIELIRNPNTMKSMNQKDQQTYHPTNKTIKTTTILASIQPQMMSQR